MEKSPWSEPCEYQISRIHRWKLGSRYSNGEGTGTVFGGVTGSCSVRGATWKLGKHHVNERLIRGFNTARTESIQSMPSPI